MATGRPVVISAVGMNKDLVRDGVNGFLASDSGDFVDALLKLARSPDLRSTIGAAGRRTVEQSYSAAALARKFAAVVRDVTANSSTR
jgi:glycosyltransferase involved in cell wall biosynthesis